MWLIDGPYWDDLVAHEATATGHVHVFVEEYTFLGRGQLIAQVRDLQSQ